MPSTCIDVRCEYSEDEEVAIMAAVHGALVVAFGVSQTDPEVRLVVHAPHRFAVPPDLARPERYTLVTVDCYQGRSVDLKRRLYRELVDRLEPLGIPRDHVTILVRDHPRENWGIDGGQAGCDVG